MAGKFFHSTAHPHTLTDIRLTLLTQIVIFWGKKIAKNAKIHQVHHFSKSSSGSSAIHYCDFVSKKIIKSRKTCWWTTGKWVMNFFCCAFFCQPRARFLFKSIIFDDFSRRSAWLELVSSLEIDHFWCVNSIKSVRPLFENRSCWLHVGRRSGAHD